MVLLSNISSSKNGEKTRIPIVQKLHCLKGNGERERNS